MARWKAGFNGGGTQYMVNRAFGIEFNYLRQDANAPFTYYNDGG